MRNEKAQQFIDAISRGEWRASLCAGGFLSLFYLLTAAANLAETDDVYEFAYRAEQVPASEVSDPRLMLYHMLMRGLYLVTNSLAPDVRALWVMRVFSAVCAAALLLLLLRVLLDAFKLPLAMAALTVMMLGVTYGFWRYAAEAEVYIPAMLLTLWVLQRLLGAQSVRDHMIAGALAGVAVLFYQPNVIPLLMAFPLLFVRRRQFRFALVYVAVAVALTVMGYAAGFALYWPEPASITAGKAFLAQRSSEFIVPPLSLKIVVVSLIRSGFAFGHDVVAATWLFGFEPAAALIQRAFSSNVIAEEIYAASRVGWFRFAPLLILPALAVLLAVALLRGTAAGWRCAVTSLWAQPVLSVLALWTALQAAVIGRLNPAGIEAWIVVLLPASLLVGVLVLSKFTSCGQRRWAWIAVFLLFAHNLTGGMAMTWDADLELDRARAEWALDNAGAEDLLIVTRNAGFAELLRYQTPAEVAFIGARDVPGFALALNVGSSQYAVLARHRNRATRNAVQLAANTLQAGGRIILFADFFNEDPLLKSRSVFMPESSRKQMAIFRAQLERVWHHQQLGATYVYRGRAGGTSPGDATVVEPTVAPEPR